MFSPSERVVRWPDNQQPVHALEPRRRAEHVEVRTDDSLEAGGTTLGNIRKRVSSGSFLDSVPISIFEKCVRVTSIAIKREKSR
jgi:hypothetical protein